jgi:MerR family mercuric resistance operon transcriptional regulator
MITGLDTFLDDAPSIGKAAQMAGVGVETIRFYEREGLIAQPPKQEGHCRRYPPGTVAKLRFIRHAKDLGFSLEEVRELLRLGEEPRTACNDARARAEEEIAAIDEKLARLTKMREALLDLTAACREAPEGTCPILEALGAENGAT